MLRLPAQILSFFAAGLLILPVGWCCILPAAASTPSLKATKPVPSCCGHKQESKPSSDETPAPPAPKCRCQSPEAPLPELVKTLVPPAALPSPSFAIDIDLPCAAIGRVVQSNEAPPAAGLHVLHCSWLC